MLGIVKYSVVGLGLVLGACVAPQQTATLTQEQSGSLAVTGRTAVIESAFTFARRDRLAGRPAEAARAIAQVEFIAVDLATNQAWTRLSPLASVNFIGARREWRAALGIPESAAPQAVIDALVDTNMGLANNDRGRALASLPAATFPLGGAATLERLNALPALPLTARATAFAQTEASRMEGN